MKAFANVVTFGSFNRFGARCHSTHIEATGETVTHLFVRDAENMEPETGLMQVVFQKDVREVESLAEVEACIEQRFPEAFEPIDW